MQSPTLLFQNFSTVQSEQQPQPATIVATTNIVPTTFLTTIVGTTAIGHITPPVPNQHMLAIMPLTTNSLGFVATTNGGVDGKNIAVASVTNSTGWGTRPTLLIYDPRTRLYYPIFGVTS